MPSPQHPDRLERDPGGTRLHGRSSGAQEGGGLPGLKKEEVKVEVDDSNVLQISGERAPEKDDKNDKWHRVERCGGKFLRRFNLPATAKTDEVKASMENGVLKVIIPKQEAKKPEKKVIQIEDK